MRKTQLVFKALAIAAICAASFLAAQCASADDGTAFVSDGYASLASFSASYTEEPGDEAFEAEVKVTFVYLDTGALYAQHVETKDTLTENYTGATEYIRSLLPRGVDYSSGDSEYPVICLYPESQWDTIDAIGSDYASAYTFTVKERTILHNEIRINYVDASDTVIDDIVYWVTGFPGESVALDMEDILLFMPNGYVPQSTETPMYTMEPVSEDGHIYNFHVVQPSSAVTQETYYEYTIRYTMPDSPMPNAGTETVTVLGTYGQIYPVFNNRKDPDGNVRFRTNWVADPDVTITLGVETSVTAPLLVEAMDIRTYTLAYDDDDGGDDMQQDAGNARARAARDHAQKGIVDRLKTERV